MLSNIHLPSERAKALQGCWFQLRTEVQTLHDGVLSDEICLQLARVILWDCFRETKIEHPYVVQWWLEKCIIEIRNRVFGRNCNIQLTAQTIGRINQHIVETGRTEGSKMRNDGKQPLLKDFANRTDLDSAQAVQFISEMGPDILAELFKTRLSTLHESLLQAAAVIMCYIRSDMAVINNCLLPTFEAFQDRYVDVVISDGSNVLHTAAGEQDNQSLFFMCNLIRIMLQFVPVGKGGMRSMHCYRYKY
jgi:hypothetical protein